jgi:hypothetical protein
MPNVRFTLKVAAAALCACGFIGTVAPAQAGHSTGTWKYYNPYAPAPDYYPDNSGYRRGYGDGYRYGRRWDYGDGDGYRYYREPRYPYYGGPRYYDQEY